MVKPPYQVMPDLPADQYETLKASIAAVGVKIPIEEDEDGNVLDGHNRKQICEELGIKNYPKIIRSGLTEEEKFIHARSVNLARRHLTKPQRDQLIKDQLKDTPEVSDRAIAASLGVDHKTVGSRRKTLISNGEIPHLETVIDKLGNERKKPAPQFVDNTPEGRSAIVARARQIREENSKETASKGASANIGNKSSSREDRGDNLYETPECATQTLTSLEEFSNLIWEPSCGRGAISRVLEASGKKVVISDLNDYGTADKNGKLQKVSDFLLEKKPKNKMSLITNPPYGELLNQYVAHAVRMMDEGKCVDKVAMLLNLNVLCGSEDADREYYMEEVNPARIYVFKRRLPMMHRDGWEGNKASSSMNTGWFVWEKNFSGNTEIIRVDYKKYQEVSE